MNINRITILRNLISSYTDAELREAFSNITTPDVRELRDPEAIIDRTPVINALAVRYMLDEAMTRGIEL